MINTLTSIHVVVSILLIITVLLQFGKGAETGLLDAASQGTAFGPKGNFLSKTTLILAVLFLGLSIALARFRSQELRNKSLFDTNTPAKARPLNNDVTNETNKKDSAVKSIQKKDEAKGKTSNKAKKQK